MLKNAIRTTATTLGVIACMVAMQHGYFEIKQGNFPPSGFMINAVGAPCIPEKVWHACLPAVTIFQSYSLSGFITIIVSLGLLVWSTVFVQRAHGWMVMVFLSLLLIPVGGGFVPAITGVLAGITASRIDKPPEWTWAQRPIFRTLGKLWLWSLAVLVVWMPLSWILGYYFGQMMLEASFMLFILFDIFLPLFAVFSAFVNQSQQRTTTTGTGKDVRDYG